MARPGEALSRRLWRSCLRFPSRRSRAWLARGLGGLLVAMVLGLGLAGFAYSDLEAPPPTLWVSDREGRFLGEISQDDDRGHGFWALEGLPPRIVAATLAVEDRRFWTHPGVDPRSVVRAAWQNMSSAERISGASTLAMQVARLQRPGSRTYWRKAVEASTALWLTARHGRAGVLAHYLRLVPYGNQAHGISYAARRYFRKPVADLSWAEAAFLTAIPQAPARSNPYDSRGRGRAVRRGQHILDLLLSEGAMTTREHSVARRQIGELGIPPRPKRPEEALHAVLRYAEWDARATEGIGREQVWLDHEIAPSGHATGRRVRSTLSLELQKDVSWMTARSLESWRLRGAGNGAVMVVDLEGQDGPEVIAAVGSADYFDSRHAGAIDYTRTPRSSGSTLKPFFYAKALDMGLIGPTTVLDDLARGAGGIANADGRFYGPLLPRFALATSRNVPAANLLARLGLQEGWHLLGRLGLQHEGSPERYGLGLTIGSLEVTLEDLVQAYTALATDGRVRPLRWTREPRTGPGQADRAWPPTGQAPPGRSMGGRSMGGRSDGEQPARGPRVISEAAARQATLFLSDSQARLPAFPRQGNLELPFPAAFKTGTSSRYRDAWTVAYSRRYLVGVWVGHPDHRPMHRLTGFTSAAGLAKQVLQHLHPEAEDGLSEIGFPPPREHRFVRACGLTGGLAGPACDRVVGEWLPHAAADPTPCTAHRLLAIDRLSGHLADHRTPREHLQIRSFVDLPARYAAWQRAAGWPRSAEISSASSVVTARQITPGLAAPGSSAAGAAMVRGAGGRARPAMGVGSLGAPRTASLRIVSPEDGLHVFLDPEAPEHLSSVKLAVEVDPPVAKVLWKVDGEPFALVDYPYELRWPLQPGDHTFEAELPFLDIRSRPVELRVE